MALVLCLNGRGLPMTILDPITGNRITHRHLEPAAPLNP
jgi:hypothetical protein